MGMFMTVPYVQVSGVHSAPTTHQGWILSLSHCVASELVGHHHPSFFKSFFGDKNSIYKIDVDNLDSIC